MREEVYEFFKEYGFNIDEIQAEFIANIKLRYLN